MKINGPFLLRKLIHMVSGLLFIWLAGKPHSTILLTLFILIVLLLDFGRNISTRWNKIFLKMFRLLLKPGEYRKQPAGATTLWTGLYLTFLIFPLPVFTISGSIAVLADPVAAMSGRSISSPELKPGKTVAGSAIFLGLSFIILWGYWNIPLDTSLFMSIILMIMELISPDLLENIILCLAGAFLLNMTLF